MKKNEKTKCYDTKENTYRRSEYHIHHSNLGDFADQFRQNCKAKQAKLLTNLGEISFCYVA